MYARPPHFPLQWAVRATVLCSLATIALGQAWEPAAPVPTGGAAREFAIGVRADSTIVALGGTPFTTPGEGDGVVHTLTNGVWSTPPHLDGEGPLIRQGAGMDDLGRIVFFGGVREADGEPGHARVYDLVLGVRQSIAARGADAPDDYFSVATDEANRVYAIGGSNFDGSGISTYAERYIGSSNTWQPIAAMPTAVRDSAAVADGAGSVLVIGGVGSSGARTANVARYDTIANSWSDAAVADAPLAVSGARAVRGADGLIYLMGGRSGPGSGTAEMRTWVYRAETNSWFAGPAMSAARSHFAAALGTDSYIYVIGGSNDSGGTHTCERLYTPICPQVIVAPQNAYPWNQGAARFAVTVTGGSPMAYQWRRNGAPLADGPTGTGSTISGATTSNLTISGTGEADEGSYDVVATNPCGSTQSTAATITLRYPPTSATRWAATNLHPLWADGSSFAFGISQGRVGGTAVMATTLPDGRVFNLNHPIVWDENLIPADITPAGSVGGLIYDINGDLMVGWFWHTWQCWSGGQYWTCAWQAAGYWTGAPPVFVERHQSGAEYSAITSTDGVNMVGSATYDDESGNYWSVGLLHAPPSYWGVSLAPPVASSSFPAGVDGTHQYGYIYTPNPGSVAHAAMWSGTAASFLDLHPQGYARSYIGSAADGEAGGSTYIGDVAHAGLWVNGGFVDLHPPGAGFSSISIVKSGLQAGSVDGLPGLWLGTPESFVPLNSLVPPGFSSAYISDLDIASDGALTLVGSGLNTVSGRTEALLWRAIGTLPGDANCDGVVSVGDIGAFVLALTDPSGYATVYPNCDVNSADMNGDGFVTVGDISGFVGLLTSR